MNLSGSLSAPALKADLPQAVFTDFSSLDALRSGAATDQLGSLGGASAAGDASQLEAAAKQFSSIFLHMALKSMREASFGGGILDSQQSEFYRDMFDQQLALDLSDGEGFGLTQVIVDQLSGGVNQTHHSTPPAMAAQAYSKVALVTQDEEKSVDSLSNDLADAKNVTKERAESSISARLTHR